MFHKVADHGRRITEIWVAYDRYQGLKRQFTYWVLCISWWTNCLKSKLFHCNTNQISVNYLNRTVLTRFQQTYCLFFPLFYLKIHGLKQMSARHTMIIGNGCMGYRSRITKIIIKSKKFCFAPFITLIAKALELAHSVHYFLKPFRQIGHFSEG